MRASSTWLHSMTALISGTARNDGFSRNVRQYASYATTPGRSAGGSSSIMRFMASERVFSASRFSTTAMRSKVSMKSGCTGKSRTNSPNRSFMFP